MTILKPGRIMGDTRWIGECDRCGAVVSARGAELTSVTRGDYRSDNEDFSWEACPSCGTPSSVCFHEASTASGQRVQNKLEF